MASSSFLTPFDQSDQLPTMQTYEQDDGLFHTAAFHAEQAARATKAERCKTVGDPVECVSKVIAFEVHGREAWTAESGWSARRIDLETGQTRKVFKGHQGPVTCLATLPDRTNDRTILFTGSWDKMIKTWDGQTGDLLSTTKSHTDFVKSLLVIPWLNILVSGSSDKTIQIFDLLPLLAPTGSKIGLSAGLQKIAHSKLHTRPVDCFALEPQIREDTATFFSGDSLGSIKRSQVTRTKEGVRLQFLDDFAGHQTSVSQMAVGEGGLWSVSVDKLALLHPLPRSTPPKPPIPIIHPAYIRSLLLLPSTFHRDFPILLTGSSDEHIRVYDVSDVSERSQQSYSEKGRDMPKARLVATTEGHWHDVTCMRTWIRDGEKGREPWVVSSSLDGTMRRWSMQDLLQPPPIPETVVASEGDGMTAEEEQELAELMLDD